jgi:hypothetical protein
VIESGERSIESLLSRRNLLGPLAKVDDPEWARTLFVAPTETLAAFIVRVESEMHLIGRLSNPSESLVHLLG